MHVFHLCPNMISFRLVPSLRYEINLISYLREGTSLDIFWRYSTFLKMMQSRYSWKYRRTGYVRFSSLGQNKMSAYWVYDLKSCRSYMIRLIIKGR